MQERKQRAALVSIVSNSSLVLGKLAIGLVIGSVSVVSEAIHSAVDLAASVVAYFTVRVSHLPPDEQHPYGHGKSESLSGLIEGLLIFLAGGWIIVEAVKKLRHGEGPEHLGLGVVIMAVSALVNWLVSRYLFKVGRETDSMALVADAWHLRTDVWTSFGVMAGLGLIVAGNACFPQVNLNWLDPVAAITVALLIFKAAWDLSSQAWHDLMDTHIPEGERNWMLEFLSQARPGVVGFHKFRTRKSGNVRFVECHLVLDRSLSFEASHAISQALSAAIEEQYPGTEILFHLEAGDPETKAASRCQGSSPDLSVE